MKKLIQNGICSIIYGKFQGKENQELFRCPRKLDSVDLVNYIERTRCFLGFEPDLKTEAITECDNYLGYYRLYFRGGKWYGSWFIEHEWQAEKIRANEAICAGVDEIVDWLQENFKKGCDWEMEDYLKQFPDWGDEYRHLLKPLMSEHYKVLFDSTYGNGDYPVRIHVYE